VHGAWMATELAKHGYRISSGSLYPTSTKWKPKVSFVEPGGGRRPNSSFLRGNGQGAQGLGVDQAPAQGVGP